LPRGRPRKNANAKKENENKNVQNENFVGEDYAKKFFSAMQNMMSGNAAWLFNPIWTNEILKDINMHPQKFSRDRIKELIANPRAHEKELRELSQYLFDITMQMKRLIIYMSEMLTFDWLLEPIGVDPDEMTKPAFLKSLKRVTQFMYDLDPKMHLPDIVQGMLLEDAKFMYLCEGENGYYFKELPSDYCKIWKKGEMGYEYAFDLTYFLRPGISLDDFPPEFKVYFDNFINGEDYKNNKNKFKERRWFYWQTLDPSRAVVFKYDQNRVGQTPVYAGLFLDANEIATFKELLKSKTALDVYKLLVAKIPLEKSENKTNKKDNFSIHPETAGKYMAAIQNVIQQGIRIVTSPMEIEAINLNQAETKDSIVGLGNKEFWDTSGTTSLLFSGDRMNASTMKASLRTDETFVTHLYRQFARFYNYKFKEISGKYQWRIHFEGTIFDREDRIERAMKLIQFGAPISYVAVAQGRTQQEFINMLNLESALGMREKMQPLVSAHTVSNKKNGRPQSDDLENENSEATRDNESNIR